MSVSEIRDWHSSLRTAPGFRGACHRAGHFRARPVAFNPGYEMHAPSPHPALLRSATLSIQGRVKRERSRGAPAPEFCSREHRKPSPIPVGRPPAVVPAPSRSRPAQKKSGRRNADRRVNLPSASGMRPPPVSLPHRVRGGSARGALACRRSSAALAAANQRRRSAPARASWDAAAQALAESRLSQSSELLADRSWCRPGVFPEPLGDGSDEPPPAGTALAPAAGVTRLPS